MSEPAHRVRFVPVSQADPVTEPLLAELAVEYSGRYGGTPEEVMTWLRSHPAHQFEPPGGGAVPHPDPDHCAPLREDQLAVVKDRTATQFVGDPDQVAHRLEALQRVSDADELVITSVTHRHDDRLRSPELLAKRWGR